MSARLSWPRRQLFSSR